MRKKSVLMLLALLTLSISACGGQSSSSQSSESSIEPKSSEHSGPFVPGEESHEQRPHSSEQSESESSSQSSSSSVTEDINVIGVSLNYEEYTIYQGKKKTLIATINPYNATNKNVTWASSDESVVTVDNGTISGVSLGEANITVTTVDGGYAATCKVTVIEDDTGGTYVPGSSDSDIFTITESNLSEGTLKDGEYTFEIKKDYKQIYVNVPNAKVILELKGVTIENDDNSPIYVADCDGIEISAKSDTINNINDTRATYIEDDSLQGKGAIYVDNGDLKLKGSGTLNVNANYYNGIHGKDDVKIQKETLNINAVHHGIKGNDSITVVSGTINISCGGDGLHTENSDISSKGNQRGNVTISGGSVTINSWGDAIAASYNAIVEEADATELTTVDIKTNKYSSYEGKKAETSENAFYLKMNSSTYSNGNYTYAAQINGSWYKATYKGTLSNNNQAGTGGGGPGGQGGGGRPGGSSTYYIYELQKPSSATSFTLYRFAGNNVASFSTDSYDAVSDAKAFNSAYDMVQISVSNKKISFSSWSNYSSGNSNGADISAKGIKAENEIYIKAGTISISAYDDAIHANNDGSLENGSTPLGNVNISGGNLALSASDDAIHADYTLNISKGTINVTTAYEGLEANLINISGGETFVYATDDGLNAASGKSTPNITVSGGFLDVAVPSNGDTDGIDSNGAFTQSGGVVICKGPGNASGNNFGAAALDTDGNVTLTDGTLIVFGGIEKTPSTSLTKTLCASSSVSAGNHTITFTGRDTAYTTTLKNSTNGCVVYSSLGTATLS